jgi:hypothetical protein
MFNRDHFLKTTGLLLATALLVLAGCSGSGSMTSDTLFDFRTIANGDATLAGRAFRLTDMEAVSVVGDSTFYMGPQADDGAVRLFAVLENLNESETAGSTGMDGDYTVKKGDVFTAEGIVMALRLSDAATWEIESDSKVYLSVRRLMYNQ